MRFSIFCMALSVMVLGFGGIAQADKPQLISQHGYWGAYTYTEGGNKVCFMASSPTSAKGNYTSRGDIFALITHRPGENSKDVVSYVTGYDYKPDSEATITIGNKSYKLFVKDDTAWTPDTNMDKELTAAIKNGSKMVIKGISARGTLTTDTVALSGSTAAYNAITKACGL